MKLIYVYYGGLSSPVFDSQILGMVEFLSRQGVEPTLMIFFEHDVDADKARKKALLEEHLGTRVLIVKRPLFLGRFFLRTLGEQLAKAIEDVEASEPLVLHCRGQIAAYIALHAKALLPHASVSILSDIRGIPEEILSRTNIVRWPADQFRYREMKKIGKVVYTMADGICCVSNAFRDYIANCSGRSPNRITVIHTAVNTNLFQFDPVLRAKMRDYLGLREELVFAYSGSLAPWQMPDKVLELFVTVQEIHPDSRLLILTKDISILKKLLRKYKHNIGRIRYVSVDYTEVPRYLVAADIGILLRKDTLINRVAFPTKYAEYLSSGLFVVATKGIRDTTAYTAMYPTTGYIMQDFPEINSDELRNLITRLHTNKLLTDTSRQKRSIIATDLFGTERVFSKYLEVYSALASD